MAWSKELETAFYPKTVAIVGVSSSARRGGPWRPGGSSFIGTFEHLGFKGNIYPVNPNTTEIMDYKTYPTVSAIPEQVDLVITAVPAKALPDILEDCIVANAKNIHVFTSGFEETGEEEAKKLGQRVYEIAVRGGLRLIGPNCMGLYVPEAGIGTFDSLPVKSGPVAFISQSGGHCNWFSHNVPDYGIHCSKVISFGNAYVLDSTDFLEYISEDPKTEIVCMYLEGVKNGAKLFRQVKILNTVKPVIIWKSGLTESGSRAVASHTASLAGQEAIWRGFFAQTGAVAVNSLEEMAEMAMTFFYVKPPKGNRVAVVVLGGGSSVAAADICNREGLQIPALTEKTQTELKTFISLAGASIRNPLDTGMVFMNVARLERELELVAADPLVDMLIIRPHLDMVRAAGPEQINNLIDYLSDFSRNNSYGKPVALVFHSFDNDPEEAALRARLQTELPQKGIAVYKTLEGACRALARFSAYHRIQKAISCENQ